MIKKTLGLPLEYNELSHYFDALSSDNDDSKNAVIENILKKYNVKTILDLTCGTGSQVLYLAKHAYQVIGADFSHKLITIAREKAKQQKLDVTFLDGDMRTIHAGTFDAVITIFNAIGHLTKDDFGAALDNITRNLTPNGLYVFDIFNLQAMTDEHVHNLAMDTQKTIDATHIHHSQYSTLDRKMGQLTSYDHYTIKRDFDNPVIMTNQFTLQIYTVQELQNILFQHSFSILEQYGINGESFDENATLQILVVAKKI